MILMDPHAQNLIVFSVRPDIDMAEMLFVDFLAFIVLENAVMMAVQFRRPAVCVDLRARGFVGIERPDTLPSGLYGPPSANALQYNTRKTGFLCSLCFCIRADSRRTKTGRTGGYRMKDMETGHYTYEFLFNVNGRHKTITIHAAGGFGHALRKAERCMRAVYPGLPFTMQNYRLAGIYSN